MNIIQKKGTPNWAGKIVRCKCGCKFELEIEDAENFKHHPSTDCGYGYDTIPCPECGEDVIC